MAAVNLKTLVNKLNPICKRALEGAAGLCLSRTNYNVEIEHWLLKLLESADTDLARILRQYDVNASQPVVVAENRVFLSSGYGHGAVMLEIVRADRSWSVREVWRNIRMKNQFSSTLLHDGYLYGLDESILACLDAATGDVKWKGGRYGYGQVVLASGHLIVLTESGELALVRATPDGHQELARVPAIDGKTWNHPALSDGYLLVRNGNEMAAFDLNR